MDTRESGPWIAAQVAEGLRERGVRARFAGVITTPGVAYLTRQGDFVAGVMISASHNPYADNGLKVFDHSGYKLPDEQEEKLEDRILAMAGGDREAQPLAVEAQWDGQYVAFLASTFPLSLKGKSLVLDCGHGAAAELAPELFEKLGAQVHKIGCAPDGRNINLDCGALHVDGLRRHVLNHGADAGFAFDGDADRCIAVSSSGRIIDGDHMLLVCAARLLATGHWDGSRFSVVATVMSNLGLEKALTGMGVPLLRTAVGDKYVLEEMRRTGSPLGGEQSGHLIFPSHATTGDGLLTALRVLEAMMESGASLDELVAGLQVYPQKLVNVRVKERKPLQEMTSLQRAIQKAETELRNDGRVLVRFSGTEPLLRVMVEGPSMEMVDRLCADIAGAVRDELA
jgi:phosphoglucosamine mutase